MLNPPTFRLLVVSFPGGPAAVASFESAYGSFRVEWRDSLAALHAAPPAERVDAVVLGAAGGELGALAGQAALTTLAAEAALVVVTAGEPEASAALGAIDAGAQQVLPCPDPGLPALARELRLAIERHARERAARTAASTDLHTGLPNQAQLIEHASQLLALRERAPAPMVVLVLRIEGLAPAEAALGREAVNALRRKIAVRLRAAMRAGDVVASLAADSFGVLLPQVKAADDGVHVAAKLALALQAPLRVAGRQVPVAVAVGIAQSPRDGKEAAALLRLAADQAALAPARGAQGAPGPTRADAANDD